MARATKLRKRFGRRLRELRQRRGWSLETPGERARLDDKYLQAVETARQAPTLDTVEKIAVGLGVQVVELFSEELPAATRQRVAKLADQMGEEDLRRVAVVMEAFTGRSRS